MKQDRRVISYVRVEMLAHNKMFEVEKTQNVQL